jgi:multidrug efflux pump subunit AcrB
LISTRLYRKCSREINQLQASLPKEVRPPVINKFALDELPILKLAVSANLAGTDFYDLVKNRVVSEISQVKGVAQVSAPAVKNAKSRLISPALASSSTGFLYCR